MVKKRMKTNAKSTTIVEKKLKEIECLLEEFGSGDLNSYRKIQDRFIFTKTLLAAEISSVEGDEDEELKLACMAQWLTELEEAFDNQLTGPVNESGVGVAVSVDETSSVFSLVEPLPEEFQDASFEKKVGEDSVAGKETGENKKNRLRVLVSFGIVGFVAAMVSYFGYFCDQMNYDDAIFLTAT